MVCGGRRIAPYFLIFWQERRDIGQLHVSGTHWVEVGVDRWDSQERSRIHYDAAAADGNHLVSSLLNL